MNIIKPKTALASLIACFALYFCLTSTAIFETGCKTTPYKAVATTQITVQAAMSLWGAYVSANHPPVAQELAVKSAYEKWQSAMAVVCDAGKAYSAAQQANAANQSILLGALSQAVTDAATDQADIVDLLTKFGVKL